MEYTEQKAEIIKLLDQAEDDLREIFERHQVDPVKMASDVVHNKGFIEQLREATEDMISKLKHLSEALSKMTHSDHKPIIETEVNHINLAVFIKNR